MMVEMPLQNAKHSDKSIDQLVDEAKSIISEMNLLNDLLNSIYGVA